MFVKFTLRHEFQRSPGGSSGGEGCLMAQGGSLLGMGSDVGGSLRTPASFCGVVGIKPTSGRIYQQGRRTGAKVRFSGFHFKDIRVLICTNTYKLK